MLGRLKHDAQQELRKKPTSVQLDVPPCAQRLQSTLAKEYAFALADRAALCKCVKSKLLESLQSDIACFQLVTHKSTRANCKAYSMKVDPQLACLAWQDMLPVHGRKHECTVLLRFPARLLLQKRTAYKRSGHDA